MKKQCTTKIKYLWIKYLAMERLSSKYVRTDNHNRAVDASLKSEIMRVKFWDSVFEIYPQLKDKQIKYDLFNNLITRGDK